MPAALTVLALAGGAQAQSELALYGLVDLGLERTRMSPGGDALRLTSGLQSSSRWGIKGREDLGGGLFASFRLETSFDASNGAAGRSGMVFGAHSWVGLSGRVGSLRLGRQPVPLAVAEDTIDPFAIGITGDGAGMGSIFRSYGVQMSNGVGYSTPNLDGISADVIYSLGELPGGGSAGSQHGLSATYERGPLTLLAAHHGRRLPAGSADAGASRTSMLAGMYDFKSARLHAAAADNRDKNADGAKAHSHDYMLDVSVPAGVWSLLASVARHKDQLTADVTYWALGATYALSSRTNFYTSYSVIHNPSGAPTTLGLTGNKFNWTNIGVRHRF